MSFQSRNITPMRSQESSALAQNDSILVGKCVEYSLFRQTWLENYSIYDQNYFCYSLQTHSKLVKNLFHAPRLFMKNSMHLQAAHYKKSQNVRLVVKCPFSACIGGSRNSGNGFHGNAKYFRT